MNSENLATLESIENWTFEGLTPAKLLSAIQDTAEEDSDSVCTQFDAADGLYCFCVDYHGGQSSELYGILSELGAIYSPSMGAGTPESETAQAIYDTLAEGVPDAV